VSLVTTINICSHPERQKVDYVLSGLRHSPRVDTSEINKGKLSLGTQTALHKSIIDEYLANEVSLGRVFGPTAIPPLEGLQVRLTPFWRDS
jgi:hypothetical protein